MLERRCYLDSRAPTSRAMAMDGARRVRAHATRRVRLQLQNHRRSEARANPRARLCRYDGLVPLCRLPPHFRARHRQISVAREDRASHAMVSQHAIRRHSGDGRTRCHDSSDVLDGRRRVRSRLCLRSRELLVHAERDPVRPLRAHTRPPRKVEATRCRARGVEVILRVMIMRRVPPMGGDRRQRQGRL